MGGGSSVGSDEGFVRRHAQNAFNLALRMTGDPGEAEKLSQETIRRSLKALQYVRQKSDSWSWICKIAVNAWKAAPKNGAKPAWEGLPPALGTLPADDRVLLVIRHSSGMTEAELAETFALPEPDIRARLTRLEGQKAEGAVQGIVDRPLPEGYLERLSQRLEEENKRELSQIRRNERWEAIVAKIKDFGHSVLTIVGLVIVVILIKTFMPDFFPSLFKLFMDFIHDIRTFGME